MFFLPSSPSLKSHKSQFRQLHTKHFLTSVQILILYCFFTRFSLFKFFKFIMETMTCLYNGYPCTSYKFYQSVRAKERNQLICFLPVTGGFKNGIIFPDSHCSCAVFTEQPFYLDFFGNLVCTHFIHG